MKHYEEIEIPAKTEKILSKITCDMCGREIKREAYSAEEVKIKHRTGSSYPEGGVGETTYVDLCGKCFDEKLIPWLRSQGVKPYIEEWYW